MPDRITLSRAKGWRMPENTVKVDRTTHFGNPWQAAQVRADIGGGDWSIPGSKINDSLWAAHFFNHSKDSKPGLAQIYRAKHEAIATRAAVDMHRTLICHFMALNPAEFEAWIAPLRGKNLACWCKRGQPCHADVLLELANA